MHRFVVPEIRVRFPVVAQMQGPLLGSFAFGRLRKQISLLSSGIEKRSDVALPRASWGRKYLVYLESLDEQIYLVTCDRFPVVALLP